MAYLRLYKGQALQRQWKIESNLISIGRSEANNIVLPSTGVSKYHAIIVRDAHSLTVIDQNSANGIFVNDVKVHKRKLQYWDEIQIFEYVIRYMASARLPGEQEGVDLGLNTEMRDESTREIQIENLSELAALRKDRRMPHLEEQTQIQSVPVLLKSANLYIGKTHRCDIKANGWFKPRISGQIQRRSNGIYLSRFKRGNILVNGRKIQNEVELKDNDDVMINRRHFKFFHRPILNL
jgi:hypothetical protein